MDIVYFYRWCLLLLIILILKQRRVCFPRQDTDTQRLAPADQSKPGQYHGNLLSTRLQIVTQYGIIVPELPGPVSARMSSEQMMMVTRTGDC